MRSRAGAGPDPPELVLFFGTIRRLEVSRFLATQGGLTPAREREALAHQIHALSRNVFRKHVLVNTGFVLFGVALIAFLTAGAAYVAAL